MSGRAQEIQIAQTLAIARLLSSVERVVRAATGQQQRLQA